MGMHYFCDKLSPKNIGGDECKLLSLRNAKNLVQ